MLSEDFCHAKTPDCPECPAKPLCPSARRFHQGAPRDAEKKETAAKKAQALAPAPSRAPHEGLKWPRIRETTSSFISDRRHPAAASSCSLEACGSTSSRRTSTSRVLPGDDPVAGAVELARRKADSVSKRVDDGFVIGADTIVWGDGFVLGKPRDRGDARRMLELLSGRTHRVTTGFAVVRVSSRTMLSGEVTARVTMRRITAAEIEAFVASGEADDKAGAYGIQGAAGAFVTQVEGSRDAVVGLPVQEVLDALAELGWRHPTGAVT